MATKQYQWRAATKYASTTTLSYGVTPSDKSEWQTEDVGTEETSQTWTWWYRDSNTSVAGEFTDDLSSRVAISITESWTTSVDSRNNLNVTVRVSINSVVRDDLRGTDQDTPGRIIDFYREQGGEGVLELIDNQVATAHTLYSGPLVIDEYSFTIAPGGNFERSTLYCHNQAIGYPSYDEIWLGIQFRNPLPAETIVGAIYKDGDWYSHNRTGGHAQLYTGSGWGDDMRSADGGVGTDNPPYIRHSDNTWRNQRTFGIDA